LNGVKLKELDASDMLDVIHYILEEDMTPAFVEDEAKAKVKIRSVIYREMYGVTYNSGSAASEGYASSGDVMPYVPPTDPEDFGKILGSPLGGG
jgi:hypothetical protein